MAIDLQQIINSAHTVRFVSGLVLVVALVLFGFFIDTAIKETLGE